MKITEKIKVLFVFAIALLFANNSQAQETKNFDQGFRLGIGLNGGIPTNNDTYNWSLGGDVRLQYDLTPKASLTLTTGFTNLFIDQNVKDLGFIPAKAGFKLFVLKDQLYLLGEVGGGFAVTNGYDKNTYIWAPGIGFATENIDVSVRYEAYTDYDTDQIALRVAYGFKL
ncbi:porin family protein [Flavobacterium sp. N3904]|uniref:porin family protein n=1 Tax=Flavobacterium sp. N3904 TaxID=2986835 RepID=UPI0022252B0A|nr:porin family protein [Flavobacterium sp. N3904]